MLNFILNLLDIPKMVLHKCLIAAIQKTQNCHVKQLTIADVTNFSDLFHKNLTKVAQDGFILQHCSVSKPNRVDKNAKGPKKNFSVQYSLTTANKKKISICRAAFIRILNVSRNRLQKICKNVSTGSPVEEKRGGDHRSFKNEENKMAVIVHIKKFRVLEQHYSRGKSIKRQYLPSELNVSKMWKMFKAENPETTVGYRFYNRIFLTHFNKSFKHPATDVCSTCYRH